MKRGEEAKRLIREREGLLKTLGNDEHTRNLLNRTDVSRKELDSYLHSVRRLHTSFSGRYVFIAKLWINWFTLHRHAAMAVDAFLGFPEAIRKYIETILPFHAVEQFGSGDDILKYYSAVEDGLANVASVVRVNEINSLDPEGTFSTSIKDIDENSPTFVRAALDVRLTSDGAAAAIADFKGNMTCEPYARRFIGVCPLLAVTSLSAKSSLPLVPGLFDLLVIDEASQCDVASALPLVFRAKQIVIIGDPKQLTHITSVKPEEEKCVAGHLGLDDAANLGFATMSLWDHSRNWLTHASANAAPLLLDGHYRCHPDIIAFSNNYFYGGRLMVHTGGRSSDPGCVWIDVRGMMRPDERTNEEEANVVCEKVKVLMALYPNRSLGIVTPYKAQAELIHRRLKLDAAIDISKIVVSTVHKFQGDERDMIIYDIVLSDGARAGQIKWVDELLSNLVNVAVTRARKALYVVGNAGFVAQKSTLKSPLGALLQHVKNRGGLLEK